MTFKAIAGRSDAESLLRNVGNRPSGRRRRSLGGFFEGSQRRLQLRRKMMAFPSGFIQICASGHVHLQFGNATIHLSVVEFRSFLQAAEETLQEFEDRADLMPSSERGFVDH